ncbi:hypothetical protein [Azospirillum sp. sgz301742]
MTISEDEVADWLASLDDGDLSERKRLAEARRVRAEQALARLGQDQRKIDTRRKIVVGSSVLAAARRDPESSKFLYRVLNAAVTMPRDRALLGLDPLPPADAGAGAPAQCDDRH